MKQEIHGTAPEVTNQGKTVLTTYPNVRLALEAFEVVRKGGTVENPSEYWQRKIVNRDAVAITHIVVDKETGKQVVVSPHPRRMYI